MPKPDIQNMSKHTTWRNRVKRTRKISRRTVRQMAGLKIGRLREKLVHRCHGGRYAGCRVYAATECHTSSTCPRCLRKHKSLGGSRVFVCGGKKRSKGCGFRAPRDFKSLMSIWLFNIGESESIVGINVFFGFHFFFCCRVSEQM